MIGWSTCLAWWMLAVHPFFVSVVEIEQPAASAGLEIGIKIFTDDLENTLRAANPGAKLDLMDANPTALEDSLISRYLRAALKLATNGKGCSLQYVGHQRQEESTWCFFETVPVATIQNLSVDCSILYDYKKEQINIFHVKTPQERKSYRLSHPERRFTMTF